MMVQVRLFALARELAQLESVQIHLPPEATVAQLRDQIAQQVPRLAPIAAHLMFALDTQYADDSQPVRPEQEVACIPPVSGG